MVVVNVLWLSKENDCDLSFLGWLLFFLYKDK